MRHPPGPGGPNRAGRARRFIHLLRHFVPEARRHDWAEEWLAELWQLERRTDASLSGRKITRLRFCLGAIPHVYWERRRHRSQRPSRLDLMDAFVQDLRFAARAFMRNPAFFVMAVVMLALGIGASTVIFAAADGVLLRPLPYADGDRLVVIGTTNGTAGQLQPVNPILADEWRSLDRAFEIVVAGYQGSFDLVTEAEPQRLDGAGVTAEYFELLGQPPAIGRGFLRGEDLPGSGRVAVVSHRLWRSAWGGDPDLVGQTIRLSGQPFTVVGVTGAEFDHPEVFGAGDQRVDLWFPLEQEPPDGHGVRVLAKLQAGTTREQARVALEAATLSLTGEEATLGVVSLQEATIGNFRRTLMMLGGAVGFLLLIACANVSHLLLARATGRRQEIAMRTALGATRGRIAQQLVTEGVLLASIGALAGTGVAVAGLRALKAMSPGDIPRLASVTLDLRVLGFAAALAVTTGVLFGLAPALQVLGGNLTGGLKDGSTNATPGVRADRLRGGLVALEVALALVLTAGAGLLFNSFVRLSKVDPGFRPEGAVVATVVLGPGYQERSEWSQFFEEGIRRLEAGVPGAVAVGAASNLPLDGSTWRAPLVVEGYTPPPGSRPVLSYSQVSPGYFRTLGMKVVEGRGFNDQDVPGGDISTVANQAFANQYWPGGTAIGGRIKMARSADSPQPWFTVVGVVNDVREVGLDVPVTPEIYVSYLQLPADQMSLVVRADAPLVTLVPSVRRALWELDPTLPVDIRTLESQITETVAAPRFYTALLVSFATMAFLLAVIGVYGTMSYLVAQRTSEVGIRVALGARPPTVLLMILRQGMTVSLIGVAAGLAGAIGAARLLNAFLFEVSSTDTATLSASALGLTLAAFVACYVPARRATRMSPITALRPQ